MRSLNFNGTIPQNRARMRRRAWFTVFGADRVQPGQKITSVELEERMSRLYSDIELNEVFEPLSNYVATRNQIMY